VGGVGRLSQGLPSSTTMPDPYRELDTPNYQILENTLLETETGA